MDTKAPFPPAQATKKQPQPAEVRMLNAAFDPELLYVECARCGKPVLWNPGDTTKVLTWAGIDTSLLDEKCMIVSEGCPGCQPEQRSFTTQVVRLRTTKDATSLGSALKGQLPPAN